MNLELKKKNMSKEHFGDTGLAMCIGMAIVILTLFGSIIAVSLINLYYFTP